MPAWLSADELQRLTGRVRPKAQRRVLDERKIRYTLGGKSGQEPLVRESDLDGGQRPARNRSAIRLDLVNQ